MIINRLYYMVDRCGNVLEASTTSGFWEKYGVSNIEVLKSSTGVTRKTYKIGFSKVKFKMVIL
ncbi:MAG: hypothetical protein RIR48_1749 [Bacteroidota bacterium]